MATYVPNAETVTEPVASREVGSAAEEFRALKTYLQAELDADADEIGRLQTQTLRVPGIETVSALPPASQRADTQLLFDSAGEPYCGAPVSGSAADVMLQYASTDAGKGAALVGVQGGGTVQDAVDAFVYVASGSDDTAALSARDTAAAAAGKSLILKGAITVSAAITFAALVRPSPGCRITTGGAGGGTKWLKFSAGVDAGMWHWLETDWPTQFISTRYIYPQWFGSCGGAAEDSSIPLIRAFLACRASFSASSDFTDKTFGCRTVWFASGTYNCSNVVVYAGTNIDGEWGGSPYGPSIMQIDYNNPALRFVPKNYSLAGVTINSSVGQNHIENIRLGNELPSSSFDGEPVCKFMSPAQATTYLAIAGDAVGPVGHIDTQFEKVWFKQAGVCIGCDEGMLWVHISRCTFDVVYKAVQHSGTSFGMVRSYNNVYYGCVHGAIHNTSSDATTGVRWDLHGDEFKAGQCYHGTADWRRALNYNPTVNVAGSFVRIHGAHFWKQTSLGATTSGTATSATASTLTAATAWTTNQWTGGYVYITGGTGAGQAKYVSSNTANTITISGTWTVTPDATSTYYIEMLRIGGPVFIKNVERLEGGIDMFDPDCLNVQRAVAIQDGVKYINFKAHIVSEKLLDYTTGALVKITQATQAIAGGVLEVVATNTGAVAIPAALDSDFAVDSKLSIAGLKTAGSFTAKRGTNLAACDGQPLVGSLSCAIGTLADDARSSAFNITVAGASVGDAVVFAPGGSLAGCQYDGYVSAPNNVVFYAYNGTGVSQSVGTVTISAWVTRAA